VAISTNGLNYTKERHKNPASEIWQKEKRNHFRDSALPKLSAMETAAPAAIQRKDPLKNREMTPEKQQCVFKHYFYPMSRKLVRIFCLIFLKSVHIFRFLTFFSLFRH